MAENIARSVRLGPSDQIHVTNHAGIVHPAVPALSNLLVQVWQTHIGTVALNQGLLRYWPARPHLEHDRRTMWPGYSLRVREPLIPIIRQNCDGSHIQPFPKSVKLFL